jgi:hypothetical protein
MNGEKKATVGEITLSPYRKRHAAGKRKCSTEYFQNPENEKISKVIGL